MRFWIIVDALCRCRLSSSSFFVLIESDSLIFHPRWRWAVLFTADILFSIFSVTSRSVHRCDALIIIIIAQPLTCWITEQAHKLFHFTSHTTKRSKLFSLTLFFLHKLDKIMCCIMLSLLLVPRESAPSTTEHNIRTEKQIWVFSDEKFSFLRPKLASHFSRSGIVV